ncbi:MAG: cobalamin biosynthesis protein CobD/CbiB [Bacteroidia bacterium]|jgi:cobalamin biosynthesis protein CobD/CbiB
MAAVIAGAMQLIHSAFSVPVSNWSWGAMGFFFGLNLLIHFLSENMAKSSQKSFLTFMYGSIAMRFIFSIFFIVIYLMVNEVRDKIVIVNFLFLYLLFTTFELYHLVAKLRTEK